LDPLLVVQLTTDRQDQTQHEGEVTQRRRHLSY
jgi:hypothetical protein